MNQQHDSTGHQHTANLSSDMVVPDRSSQAVQDKFNVRSTPLIDEQTLLRLQVFETVDSIGLPSIRIG